jgi:hypothetical protein
VTRVFSKSRDLYVYLQGYEQEATSVQPLVAFVSLYRGQSKAMETKPIEVADALNSRLKTIPLQLSVSLNGLPAGKYDCQISVLDPSNQKAAFWRAPIVLVP